MILLILALGSCVSSSSEGTACESDYGCSPGEACVRGACTREFCTSSADCAMEQHCDDRSCVEGCAVDEDCYPGQSCAAGVCEVPACTDTHTDCSWREWCQEGSCVDAGDAYCAPCSSSDECASGVCVQQLYCGQTCVTRDDCPAGFDCADVKTGDDAVFACVSACWEH